jgi:hypothetical protein
LATVMVMGKRFKVVDDDDIDDIDDHSDHTDDM